MFTFFDDLTHWIEDVFTTLIAAANETAQDL